MKRQLLTFLLFFISANTIACSCSGSLLTYEFTLEDYTDYDQIFIGKVIAEDSITDPMKSEFTFETETIFKGDSSKTIKVLTGRVCCICGYSFEIGQRYLVSVIKGETNTCSWNINLSNDYEEFRSIQGKLVHYENGKSINLSGNKVADLIKIQDKKRIAQLWKLKYQKRGTLKLKHKKANVVSSSKFRNYKMHGKSIFYYANGDLKGKFKFKKGKKNGKGVFYEREPKKEDQDQYIITKHSGKFKNNVQVGKWKYEVVKGSYKETYYNKEDKGEIIYK